MMAIPFHALLPMPVQRHHISRIMVAVPARNEQALISGCLRSIVAAFAHAHTELGPFCPELSATVVADGCTDHTAEYARGILGVTVIEQPPGGVGAARRTAITSGLRTISEPLSQVWIINTDADTRVEPDWITEHLGHADNGADLVIGTVRPDFADLSHEQVSAWMASHHRGQPNGHVHGANLGIRASAYLGLGGFADLSEHEDVDLVERARQGAYKIVAADSLEVVTSGRQVGRSPGGYARFLREDLRLLTPSPNNLPSEASL